MYRTEFGTFSGNYELRHPRGWPHGIHLYEPAPGDPFQFTMPGGITIVLDQKFLTDLASTPRCVWWVHGLAPADMEEPSLVHDWLYQTHHLNHDMLNFHESNRVLQLACLASGYSRPMAWSVREACDLFGKGIWDHGSGKQGQKLRLREHLLLPPIQGRVK